MKIPRTVRQIPSTFALNSVILLAAITGHSVAQTRPAKQHMANPPSLNFGSVQVGNYLTLNETVTNVETSSTVTISAADITGPGFSMSGLTPPVVLTPGQQYTFSVTFTPAAGGNAGGSISVTTNARKTNFTISLSGTGTSSPAGQLAVAPTALAFGNVTVGSNANQQGTLNASAASVTVTSGSVNNSAFALSGLALPATIPAGQDAQFTVTFTPPSSGPASGTVSFASNASNSPTVELLTGAGVGQSHLVNLSWNADNSPDVVGYNIYRGITSGGPFSKLNAQLNPGTTYTDGSVVSGQTYYYVTTALNSAGMESAYSNETQAVIP
jgi:hypothetical protein